MIVNTSLEEVRSCLTHHYTWTHDNGMQGEATTLEEAMENARWYDSNLHPNIKGEWHIGLQLPGLHKHIATVARKVIVG